MVGTVLLQRTVIRETIAARNKFSGLKNRIFAAFGPIDSGAFNKSLLSVSYNDTSGNNVVVDKNVIVESFLDRTAINTLIKTFTIFWF